MLLKTQNSKVKVIIFFTLLILVLSFAHFGCDNRSTKVQYIILVTDIELEAEEITMIIGRDRLLIATIKTENATNTELKWDSSDREVVDVSEDGLLTAVSIGEAIITVSSVDGGASASCLVIVLEEPIPVTSVFLNDREINMNLGYTEALLFTIEPENATNQNVVYDSSDSEVVDVSEDGLLTAVSEGMAIITITTEDGGFTDSCEVTVSIWVSSISVNHQSISLNIGGSETLQAIIEPENATNQNISWYNSDPSVASFIDGVVIAISPGTSTITVISEDGGFEASCEVTIYPVDYFLVSNEVEWINAVSIVNESNEPAYHIVITEDLVLSERTEFYSAGALTISGNRTISLSHHTTGHLFDLWDQTLILEDIALKGHLNNSVSLVAISGGHLFMQGNSSISGNRNTNHYYGGGGVELYHFDASLTMKDNASIYGNRAYRGGGVYADSGYWNYPFTIIMRDNASISGNTSDTQGGGVFLNEECILLMYDDASIDDNNSHTGGGLYNMGTITLHDRAKISNNQAYMGGGVYLAQNYYQGGILDLKDFSTINGNVTPWTGHPYSMGAGIFIGVGGLFRMYDNSVIYSNFLYLGEGGAGIYQEGGNFIMYGGIVYGDNYHGGVPVELQNYYDPGSAIYKDPSLPSSSSIYGDQTPILPHIEGYNNYTNFTIEGRE